MAAPTFTKMSISHGTPGATVRIEGHNFDDVTKVTFGGGVEAQLDAHAESYMIFKVPQGAQSGVITIENPDGSVQTSNFTVNAPIAPATVAVVEEEEKKSKQGWLPIVAIAGLVLALIGIIWLATKSSSEVSGSDIDSKIAANLASYAKKEEIPSIEAIGNSVGDLVEDKLKGYVTTTDLNKKLEGYVQGSDIFATDENGEEILAPRIGDLVQDKIKEACDKKAKERAEQWSKYGKKGFEARVNAAVDARLNALKVGDVNVKTDVNVNQPPTVSGTPKGLTVVVEDPDGKQLQKHVQLRTDN